MASCIEKYKEARADLVRAVLPHFSNGSFCHFSYVFPQPLAMTDSSYHPKLVTQSTRKLRLMALRPGSLKRRSKIWPTKALYQRSSADKATLLVKFAINYQTCAIMAFRAKTFARS